jgi:hypothetical protein
MKTIKGFKAFDKDFKCRGMQYKTNFTFEESGELEICKQGLHFCEMPLDVLNYYDLNSRFAEVEAIGDVIKDGDKIATNKLKVGGEINISQMFKAHFKLMFEEIKASSDITNTTGYEAHAHTTGYGAHSHTTGHYAHSYTTGHYAHAHTTGYGAISASIGIKSRAKAKNGWVIIVDWRYKDKWYIHNIHSGKVGGEILGTKIEADTWYWFEDGELKSKK